MNIPTILIIDDDKEFSSITEFLLLQEGYHVIFTDNPMEGVRLAEKEKPDLILLDVQMPHKSGYSVIEDLKALNIHTRVIFLTSSSETRDVVKHMRMGACDHLPKPSSPRTVLSSVRTALESEDTFLDSPFSEKEHESISLQDVVEMLISIGEREEIEFKSSCRWDYRENRRNKELSRVILKSVGGFMNSRKGGSLLIGVSDSGDILGLEQDFQTLDRKDPDGYQNFLTTILTDAYGKNSHIFYSVEMCLLKGKYVCLVKVKPSSSPMFLTENGSEAFYVRIGNSTRALNVKEAINYFQTRWVST